MNSRIAVLRVALPKALTSTYGRALFVSFLGFMTPDAALAENIGAKLWPRLKIGNEVYSEIVYMEHDASRVKFKHSSGIANLPISELPSTLQKELDYDPSKAAENEVKLASEQQAIRKQVQADAVAAHQSNSSSSNSSRQPEEKDGMIRVMETEIIPPDEVQRLGIAGLQRYRQPGESPLEQLERESKTGVIRKVWKWVPKPEPMVKRETPEMQAAKKKEKLLGEEVRALDEEKIALKKQRDLTTDPAQQKAIDKQIAAKDAQKRSREAQRLIEKQIAQGHSN